MARRFVISVCAGIFAWLVALLAASPAWAATSTDGMWSDIAQDEITVHGQQHTIPERYRTVELILPAMDTLLSQAPAETSSGGVLLTLPMPDGSFQEFVVKNSPIMEPGLAMEFPEITTYLAVATDNAATTARLDLTPAGFHAIVFRVEGTVYIDPYQSDSQREYISYYQRDFQQNREPFYCGVTGGTVDVPGGVPVPYGAPVGDVLRTYRLAVAATGEYTAFHGGTVNAGLAAIVTTINRVTGIYERELSVRLMLVANNSSLVYTNPSTDPYMNSNASTLLDQNQANLDAVIGSANYDIGHVFSTGGGGLAGLGVVCVNNLKARGETGLPTPIGDAFNVDFVAHEIGHQFGGNHTFNGTTGNCSGGNRNASTAYEPGSGSTIQAYAGICGAENLQANSDDYFHTKSFDEMTAFINGSGACATPSATGNTVPTINAGASFTVPILTPLILQADDAVDPDAGQVLTYSWEQFDLGAASPPNTDGDGRPIFRSFPAQTTTVRYLPRMSDILGNTSTLGESLPTTNRTLTFRLTVRDNALGAGAVNSATVAHQVSIAAGPFVVTSQNTPTDWSPGSPQTVTWDVAGTAGPPVNCPNVSIYYSANGFPNFSATPLVALTPNDGSQLVTAPLEETATGRVMVRCASNIFFDLNDAPITIVQSCSNGALDDGEQCDDGNLAGGDGCSATCQVEAGWECTLPAPPIPSICTENSGDVYLRDGFESPTLP